MKGYIVGEIETKVFKIGFNDYVMHDYTLFVLK